MQDHLYVKPTKELREERHRLAPDVDDAFHRVQQTGLLEGALPSKIKQLIAVAVAHVARCPYCIQVLLDQSVGRHHGIQLGVMGSSLSSQTIRQPVRVR